MKLVVLISLFTCFTMSSQYKYEREFRLNVEEVPISAVQFLKQFQFKKKVKWYGEESQDGKTFEAKTYYNAKKYSLEFDAKGKILDVEIKVRVNSLNKPDQEMIKKELQKVFSKYKIKKLQLQFSGKELLSRIKTFETKGNYSTCFFELVVSGKIGKERKLFEILMNSKGEIVKKLEFKILNSDNLEF